MRAINSSASDNRPARAFIGQRYSPAHVQAKPIVYLRIMYAIRSYYASFISAPACVVMAKLIMPSYNFV